MAVISGLRLEVTAPDGETTPFIWDEQGTWEYDPQSRGLTWIYLADPAPLVVGPSGPQLPICLFEGPPGWTWQTETYQATVVATRGQDAAPLTAGFTLTLPAESVELLNTTPRTWIEARTTPEA